jgi:hypothetical protein
MQHLMSSLRLLAIAGIFLFSSCQKQAPDVPAAVAVGTTIEASLGTAGQRVTVTLSPAQATRLKQTGKVSLEQGAISSSRGIGIDGGGVGVNCPPIPASFFTYWQAQANACCCTVVACTQDHTCAFVLYAFFPNCGPGGGGGGSEFQ